MNHLLSLATVLLAATKSTTKTSSSSYTFLIFIVIVIGALYFLFLRPNQQRARKQREDNAAISVGDRVVSIGGIVGRIEEMDGDRVVLVTGEEDGGGIAPTRLVLLRSAIARKAPVAVPEPEETEAGPEDASDDGKADGDTGT